MDENFILEQLNLKNTKIGLMGLGYVGLPLAVSLSKKYSVIGFDINKEKVNELKRGVDRTGEVEDLKLLESDHIRFTFELEDLSNCSVIIVTVPTPVDKGNKPDLSPLISASKMLGNIIRTSLNPIYICFESTVYPGCTEEVCIPTIRNQSGKVHGIDFFVGYSPERINPGDKLHKLEQITKVVSGCCKKSRDLFANIYSSIITAGIYITKDIKTAEAAKVIENTQRDINIALMNELSVIFSKLNIDTQEVLKAAGTKWNFLKFVPGLVGGHCIGVDPYYLTYKAETKGYIPKVILSGRAINDSMGEFIASETVKLTLKNKPKNNLSYKTLILGFTFKENVPDVRNTKVIDVVLNLRKFNFHVDIVDPHGVIEEAKVEYGINLIREIQPETAIDDYDAIALCVPHESFKSTINQIISSTIAKNTKLVFIDVKSYLNQEQIDSFSKNISYWRL